MQRELGRIPIADGHCDFLYGMVNYGFDIECANAAQTIALPYLKQGNVKLQTFAAWVDKGIKIPYLQQCLMMVDAYERMLEKHRDSFVKFSKEYDARKDARIATLLTVEGGEAIEGSLAVLRTLHRLGVRAMTFTWNHNNELAYAAVKRFGKGLTRLGKEVLAQMDDLAMAVDVSHLNDAGIDDVLAYGKVAPYASHSNARTICNTPRALCDEHIKEITKRGGVVGVNFYPKQLRDRGDASIKDIVAHIVHVVKVGGINGCAIGSDFDGMQEYPQGMKNPSDLQDLVAALFAQGFTKEDVERIAHANLIDYLKAFVD